MPSKPSPQRRGQKLQQQTSQASHTVTADDQFASVRSNHDTPTGTTMTPAAGQAIARPCFAPLPARPPGSADAPARDYRHAPGSHTSAELKAEPAAVAQARRLTRTTLARWQLGRLIDDAETIASELATNALNASTPPRGTLPAIIFAIHRRPRELRIVAWDNGPGQPRPAAPGTDSETGRGLAIVAALSRQWGWWPTPHSGGKVVWSSLPAPDIARHPSPDDRPQDAR
jgi:anti-sigma regulatory factor (Ser/Thr protein kinase)